VTRQTARSSALVIVLACLIAGCAGGHKPPAGYEWGLPVYPGAVVDGKGAARASFALYHTRDAVEAVDRWYAAELPAGTPHANDVARQTSTFAIFDAHSRRTVHIEREGSTTAIMLTKLDDP